MLTSRASSLLIAGLAVFATACGDATAPAPTIATPAPAPVSLPSVARMRGTVDVASGTLTFESVGGGATSSLAGMSGDIRAQVYGNQGVTVRLYSSPVTVVNPSRPGKKTFSGAVGLRNLLPHAIGDEQSTPTPLDTLGIFVVFTRAPSVTSPSPCAGCTVTLINADGVAAFDAPNEQYFFWRDRVGAAGSRSDTTRNRRTFTFEASAGVTNFSFEVLVSAAWPQPNETVWRVLFDGDSLPDTQSEPAWRRLSTGGGTSASASAGALTITTPSTGTFLTFVRQDSVSPAQGAYMEGRFRLNASAPANLPYTGMMIDDDTRAIGVGLSGTSVGFINGALNGFLPGGTAAMSTSAYRTYQLRKFGADSVQLWVDGSRVLSRPYTQFDASRQGGLKSFVAFGSLAQQGANSATYDYVSYVLGQPTP